MFYRIRNKKAQATAELAIMGSIVIMLLGYLMQQGFIYNSRQALEMYTTREALLKSRQLERGVSLTVMRDVFVPSFFTGLNRQRLISSASVSADPWHIYIPVVPGDVATLQLMQVGENMIRKGVFFQVPPTHVRITTEGNQDQDEEDQWQWLASSTSGMDTPIATDGLVVKEFNRSNDVGITENATSKTINKDLVSQDIIRSNIAFEDANDVATDYMADDWRGDGEDEHILSVEAEPSTIPVEAVFVQDETVSREKHVTTDHD